VGFDFLLDDGEVRVDGGFGPVLAVGAVAAHVAE
jgi:hypothetical protein